MSGMEIGLISVLIIIVLIYAGLYVPIALGLVSFVGVWLMRGDLEAPVYLLTLAASNGISSYIFGVIPLFVLMGLLVSQSGLAKDNYAVARQALANIKGGLGVATVAANAIFAAITGVSIASASVFTRISVPEMLRFGYQPRFAVGVVAGSSVLGMLIPPSVMLILFAIITEQSVAALFTAAIVPGILLSLAFCGAIVGVAHFKPSYIFVDNKNQIVKSTGADEVMSRAEILRKSSPIVALILIVLGGIYGGIFTPTEAGGVGALGALIVAMLKRKLSMTKLWKVLVETGHITASILLLIIAATMYSRMLALTGLPSDLGEWAMGLNIGLGGILLIYVLLLILMGTILDTSSIILILVPLFLPIVMPFDISLVWFGVITVLGAEIGLLTPPLGISCYVIKSTLKDEDISLSDIFFGAAPFALIMAFVLLLIILFPSISLVLV